MTQAPDLPMWAALLVAFLIFFGSVVTLIGSLGLLRLRSFHQRMHAPTLGSTVGAASILLGSAICFSVLGSGILIRELLIGAFLTLTTPVGFMLLARADLHRSRIEDERLPESTDVADKDVVRTKVIQPGGE